MSGLPTIQTQPAGGAVSGFSAFDGLTPEQQSAAGEMIRDAQVRDLYDALAAAQQAVNALGSLVGGFESDDMLFNFNPVTGRTQIEVDPRRIQEMVDAGDSLPAVAWADRYKVLQVMVVDETEQTVAWGKDYVRSVAATEA